MRKRTQAREYALQILYQLDIRKVEAARLLDEFRAQREPDPDIFRFTEQLVSGTAERIGEIDGYIVRHADNWDLARMAVVDRNILRLGVFELLFLDDIPSSVSINEAIELAKRYGDADSAKFINGVLDAIYKSSKNEEKAK